MAASQGSMSRFVPSVTVTGRSVVVRNVRQGTHGKEGGEDRVIYEEPQSALIGICGDAIEPHRVLASMAVVSP